MDLENLEFSDGQIIDYYWFVSTSNSDISFQTDPYHFIIDATNLDINMSSNPDKLYLSPPYPNPFNPKTTINFGIAKLSKVNIKVYNSVGQLVDKIADDYYKSGHYNIVWNPSYIPSGTYYIKLSCNQEILTRKVNFIK